MNLDDPFFMTQERSRNLGRALMALAGLQLLFFLVGALRRSYLVLAVPIGLVVSVLSALLFWVGYTLSVQDWDDPEDYPPAVSEGAPPPESLG